MKYNIGPVTEIGLLGTASAPLTCYLSNEIYKITEDKELLSDAYDACLKLHEFWMSNRDTDNDGLYEWGRLSVDGIPARS